MRSTTSALAIAAACTFLTPAKAETQLLNFDDLSQGRYSTNVVYKGYILSPRFYFDVLPAPNGASNYVNLNQTVGSPPNPGFVRDEGLLVIEREDGQRFNLEGITAVALLIGVFSSNGGFFDFPATGAYSFSGPQWTNVEWIAFGVSSGDLPRGFDNLVLTAVPEPSAGLLLACGLIGLLAMRRLTNAHV